MVAWCAAGCGAGGDSIRRLRLAAWLSDALGYLGAQLGCVTLQMNVAVVVVAWCAAGRDAGGDSIRCLGLAKWLRGNCADSLQVCRSGFICMSNAVQ